MKVKEAPKGPSKIKMKTRVDSERADGLLSEWWKAENDRELATQLCSTATYLKTNQTYRIRQVAVNVRLYANLSVYSFAGQNVSLMDRSKALPDDRPSFNLVSACTDTLVSRLTQDQPSPRFLTDGADYRQRHTAQQINKFVLGEFYQTNAYRKGTMALRDACVVGTGILKVYAGADNKVKIDRVLAADLYVDDNDSLNGEPRTLIQVKLVDRDKLLAQTNPKYAEIVRETPNSYPDNGSDNGKSTADQVMVVEGWHLPTGDNPDQPGYMPGRHTLATAMGIIFDEEWNKPKFPFVFFRYSNPFLGFWGQGLGTRLFGLQMSLNRVMYTIARSINLMGVPRIFVERSSKVVKTHLNNEIGVICEYTGTAPEISVTPSNAPDIYLERDRLIDFAFRQEGISQLQASSQKPAGLDSGEAQRVYNDTVDARFAETAEKYSQMYSDLAYLIVETAMDIAKETGKYQTIYPNKDGTKEIDLPSMKLLKDPFVIQCFNQSSLPRDPAGRIAKVTEQVQSGMLTLKEGRRLMNHPDLEDNEKLDNASEERIFKYLDAIVEDGEWNSPDGYLDLDLAELLTVQYINLYLAANLEQEKADMLRDFHGQALALKMLGMSAMQAQPMPTANPEPTPTSPLVPNTNAGVVAA